MISLGINQETSSEKGKVEPRKNAYLVVARLIHAKLNQKMDFPTYTVMCDTPEEAIEYVLSQGFSFTKGEWSIRAIHVALVGEGQNDKAKTALPK